MVKQSLKKPGIKVKEKRDKITTACVGVPAASVVVLKRKRKTKSVKDPESRTIVDIISDTRSGVPIPASEHTKFQKVAKAP